MTSPFRVASLTFNGGSTVDTSSADIVVLVGPNNTGKTRTLQEVQTRLSMQPGQAIAPNTFFVNDAVQVDKLLSPDEFAAWMGKYRYSWVDRTDKLQRVRTIGGGGEFFVRDLAALWQGAGGPTLTSNLAQHLIRGLWCGERLNYLGAPGRTAPGAHPDHPIQLLVSTPELLERFRDAFRSAFGWNVIIDGWGTNVLLRLSRTQEQANFEHSTADGFASSDLLARLESLPLIETQSDGVRSFAGIILTLLTGRFPLVLLDEPEAFLHPPQARQLGRYLAQLQRDGQLFVATHSLDILLGLIESRPDRVLIVRLTRQDDKTSATTLEPQKLAEIWRDPHLKFSRALDGLFHEGVVVTEGVTDSQFYSAIADLGDSDLMRGQHVMFTYAGDKQRVPLITRALDGLQVAVRAVVDFDALNDEAILRSLVEGLGGTYTDEMERDRRVVDANLRGSEPKMTVGALKGAINDLLGDDPTVETSRSTLRNVREAMEPQTGWRAAKRSGIAVVPSGDATEAVERLLASAREVGLYIVPSGAVESFVKAVGGTGPRWAADVIAGGYLGSASEAQQFLGDVLASLPSASR